MAIRQAVVRTYAPDVGYSSDCTTTADLRSFLDKGYRVVMVNKISNGKKEFLEYIVEKDASDGYSRPQSSD